MALERRRVVIVVKYHQPLSIPISQYILNLKANSVFIVKTIGLMLEYLLRDDFVALYDRLGRGCVDPYYGSKSVALLRLPTDLKSKLSLASATHREQHNSLW